METAKSYLPTSASPAPTDPPKLLDRIRRKHYSIHTEQAYVDWIKRFVLYFDKRHLGTAGEIMESDMIV